MVLRVSDELVIRTEISSGEVVQVGVETQSASWTVKTEKAELISRSIQNTSLLKRLTIPGDFAV
jgi:hypothetical protein